MVDLIFFQKKKKSLNRKHKVWVGRAIKEGFYLFGRLSYPMDILADINSFDFDIQK